MEIKKTLLFLFKPQNIPHMNFRKMVFLKNDIEYSYINLNRLRINYYSGANSTPHKVNMHSTKMFARLDIWQDYRIYGLVETAFYQVNFGFKVQKLIFFSIEYSGDKIYYSFSVKTCCKQILVSELLFWFLLKNSL